VSTNPPGWRAIRPNRPERPSGAFTLLELLVAIAIIAVLASFLLPALSRAKDSAHSAACKGNLRQLALGLRMYVDDTGVYPSQTYPIQSGQRPKRFWFEQLAPYVGQGWTGGVYRCPAYRFRTSTASELARPTWTEGPFGSYGYNSGSGLLGRWDLGAWADADIGVSPPLRESDLVAPSEMTTLGDTHLVPWLGQFVTGYFEFSYSLGIYPQGLPLRAQIIKGLRARHRGKHNLAFADSHIESLPYHLLSENTESARRRWCYDNQPHLEVGYSR